MRSTPGSIRYDELLQICKHCFGEPRQTGGSHAVFKMPWAGDPRVNIQKGKDGMAKAYQVRQVLKAIDRLIDQGREDVS